MTLQFFLPMVPPTHTHQQGSRTAVNHKTGKPIHYKDEQLIDIEAKFAAYLMKHVPEKPFTCGVRLITKWCYPVTGRHQDGDYKLTKPDTDDLIKTFKDVMTRVGFWKDDALVASEVNEKFYAALPGIFVSVEELPINGY